MRFWLGTHEVSWLGRTDVPLFISRRRLARQKSWARALGPWALDSGGFTELHRSGRWETSHGQYVAEVRRWRDEIGRLAWCAPRDFMCEPKARAATGLTVGEHQARTIESFLELRAELGGVVVPVLQGWEYGDYHEHVDAYWSAGVDLRREPVVGVGSVCRRQADREIVGILASLAALGLRLHAFGVRGSALQAVGPVVASADSMAWSFRARKAWRAGEPKPVACSCPGSCSNCLDFALWWREDQLRRPSSAAVSYQPPLLPQGGIAA